MNPALATFGDAVYFSVTTITTVGFGDVVPVTSSGRVFVALQVTSQRRVLVLILGVVTSGARRLGHASSARVHARSYTMRAHRRMMHYARSRTDRVRPCTIAHIVHGAFLCEITARLSHIAPHDTATARATTTRRRRCCPR